MDCGQADIVLVDYLYGELPEPERQAFELHLQSCSAHAKEVERLRAVISLMRKDPREDPSERVSNEILRAAEESIHRTSRPWGWLGLFRTPLAAAAALLVVIGIGAVVYFNEGFERRLLESAETVNTSQLSSPPSVAESDAAKPAAADTVSSVTPDERTAGLEKMEPVVHKAPAPQKTATRAKGLGDRREPLSEKPKARDEKLTQKVEFEKPSDRAFTPRPEEYHDRSAGSGKEENAMPAAAMAPPADFRKKISAEAKQVPRSMTAEVVADTSQGDKLDTKLPPLSDSDVRAIMRTHQDELSACGRKYPSVKGTLEVSVVIANDGVVSSVTTRTEEFKGTAFEECINAAIKKIIFPRFGGDPKTVRLPFTVP